MFWGIQVLCWETLAHSVTKKNASIHMHHRMWEYQLDYNPLTFFYLCSTGRRQSFLTILFPNLVPWVSPEDQLRFVSNWAKNFQVNLPTWNRSHKTWIHSRVMAVKGFLPLQVHLHMQRLHGLIQASAHLFWFILVSLHLPLVLPVSFFCLLIITY